MRPYSPLIILGLVIAWVHTAAPLPTGNEDQNVIHLGSDARRRLIQVSETEEPSWMTEAQVLQLMQDKVKFMDVTEDFDPLHPPVKEVLKVGVQGLPSKPLYQDKVKGYFTSLDTHWMYETLNTFTQFHNRYYKSPWGAKSCRWLIERIQEIAEPAGHRISVKAFEHAWDQFSIIARLEGRNKALSNDVVIIGAHQDSINAQMPDFGRSPGADDDGSGTVSILEAFRCLVHRDFYPERPVEFHWYSGEEAGLLGSQAVAKDYNERGINVVAMLQNDMTGYIGPNGQAIGIVTDYVNEKLTEFLKALVNEYASVPFVETICGYACSDHASWRKYGYPSVFTLETEFENLNSALHTTEDTIDKISLEHMKEFAKLSIAFAVELSHS